MRHQLVQIGHVFERKVRRGALGHFLPMASQGAERVEIDGAGLDALLQEDAPLKLKRDRPGVHLKIDERLGVGRSNLCLRLRRFLGRFRRLLAFLGRFHQLDSPSRNTKMCHEDVLVEVAIDVPFLAERLGDLNGALPRNPRDAAQEVDLEFMVWLSKMMSWSWCARGCLVPAQVRSTLRARQPLLLQTSVSDFTCKVMGKSRKLTGKARRNQSYDKFLDFPITLQVTSETEV